MSYNPIQYEFFGFDPAYETYCDISQIAEDLYLLSPMDSVMRVALRKRGHSYSCFIKVNSYVGAFSAEAVDYHAVDAVQKCGRVLRRKLDRWKRNRFTASRRHGSEVRQNQREVS